MITVRVSTPDDQIITRINATLQEAKEYYIVHLGTVTVEEIKEEKETSKMRKYTQRELKNMVAIGMAVDVSQITDEEYKELKQKEIRFQQIGYASGIYGCNGQLWQGEATGQVYAITGRTQAIYRF